MLACAVFTRMSASRSQRGWANDRLNVRTATSFSISKGDGGFGGEGEGGMRWKWAGAETGKWCYLGSFLNAVITFPFCTKFSLYSAATSFPKSLGSFKHMSLNVSNRSPFWPDNLHH